MPRNKFHSTITRRDFMKFIGLSGAGIGAASLVAPVFHDLDEVISSSDSNWERPWWVKKNEIGNITQEMDWSVYKRFDRYKYGVNAANLDMFGADDVKQQNINSNNRKAKCMVDKTPGYRLKERALYDSLGAEGINQPFVGWRSVKTFAQYGKAATPPIDVPRYEGTPEENIKMMRTVAKLRGAAVAGACEIDGKVEKFFFDRDDSGIYNRFDSTIEDGYETKTERVSPTKAKYILTLTVPMSEELIRRMPTALAEGAVMLGYSYGRILNAGLSNYLWTMGYLGLGAGDNSWKVHPAMAVWSGCGEASRMHQNYISPELGAMQRAFAIVTDMPLAPSEPIDFGIWRYCRTCMKCASICPGAALDMENKDPTWESPYAPFNADGQNCYAFSFAKCRKWWNDVSTGCGMCMASCPFSHKGNGTIHEVVGAIVSNSTFLDGFMRNLDDMFGYGMYPGVGKVSNPQDYLNPTPEMAAFYDAWWELPPTYEGMRNQAKI